MKPRDKGNTQETGRQTVRRTDRQAREEWQIAGGASYRIETSVLAR